MSLPVLHSFAGYGVERLSSKEPHRVKGSWLIAYCVFLANLPDLDFLPGVLTGSAAAFHRGFSHSFGAAFLCALAGAWLWKVFGKRPFREMFATSFFAYASHLVLDLMSHAPKGLELFWPFMSRRFYGPFTDFSIDLSVHPLERATGFLSFFSALPERALLEAFFFEMGTVFLFWCFWTILKPSEAERRGHEEVVFFRGALTAMCMTACILLK